MIVFIRFKFYEKCYQFIIMDHFIIFCKVFILFMNYNKIIIIKKFRRGDEVQIQSRENVVYTVSEVINDFHFGIVVKAREKRR